jgi:hypothetical protein
VLPFAIDIPVRSYLNQAFPLSVVMRHPSYYRALLGSFVQMFFPENKLEYDRVLMLPALFAADWERLGFLNLTTVDTDSAALKPPNGFIDTLIEHLHEENYADVRIDEYFLPGRPCYQTTHSVHDNLVFGYDLQAREFYVAGYGQDYEVRTVGFDDMAKAFHHAPWSQINMRWLRFMRLREHAPFGFDLAGMTAQLRDYIRSAATLSEDAMRAGNFYWKMRRFAGSWGLETYDAFVEYLRRIRGERKPLDLRATRTLWEHKACMLARLTFLESANYFLPGRRFSGAYAPIEGRVKALRFEAYEYNACGLEACHLDTMIAILQELKGAEAAVLQEAYAALPHERRWPHENRFDSWPPLSGAPEQRPESHCPATRAQK